MLNFISKGPHITDLIAIEEMWTGKKPSMHIIDKVKCEKYIFLFFII